MIRRRPAWLLVVLALAAGPLPARAAPAAGPELAFASNRDGDPDIYGMRADGSGVVQLTDHPGQDLDPSWSPDGRRIAFASDRDGDFEIYVMKDDGTDLRQLTFTDGSGRDRRPVWSPNAAEVVFDRPAEPSTGRHVDLYAVNVTTLTVRRLTNGGGVSSGGGDADWSPRPHIVMQRHTTGNWEVARLDPATGAVTMLTGHSADDLNPAWFPDGSRIAFASARAGTFDIWTMASSGSGPVRLTASAGTEFQPQVSCDGSRIAYFTNQDGNGEIYTMNADGSGQTRLTDDPGSDSAPSWRCLRNTAPVANEDSFHTGEDTTLAVEAPGVASNDSDPDGDPLTVELLSAPVHGDVALAADGSFSYLPDADFNGADRFSYTVTDPYGAASTAEVLIEVSPVNDPPVAVPDSAATPQYEPVSIDVLANDRDADGDLLAVTSASSPAHGTVTVEEGLVVYSPDATFKDADSFSYTVTDEAGASVEGTVTVTAVGCGEDGVDALHGSPADGAASRTVDRGLEPIVGSIDHDAARALHEANCAYVVPAEDL